MRLDIGEIDPGSLIIKVLTSNRTSMTLPTEMRFRGKVIQPGFNASRLLAEHGLSLSIKVSENETNHQILFDTGGLLQTVIENCKQFNIDLKDVEELILSHGHLDHFGGLTNIIRELKEGCEVYLNPVAFAENRLVITKTGEEIPAEELGASLEKLEKEGRLRVNRKLPRLNEDLIAKLANQQKVRIIKTNKPVKLYDGLITSGEIEILDESEVSRGFYLAKGIDKFEKHTFRDETSIYINIKGKGLVVLTGCAHTGLINIIRHGQNTTGIDQVYAIIGGFHKEYESDQNIEEAVRFIESLNPDITCGMHCTGFNFNRTMVRHPSHTLGVVGTEFRL